MTRMNHKTNRIIRAPHIRQRVRISISREMREQDRLRGLLEKRFERNLLVMFSQFGIMIAKEFQGTQRIEVSMGKFPLMLSQVLNQNYRQIIQAFAERTIRILSKQDEELFERLSQLFIEAYGAAKVTNITATIRADMKKAILAGVRANKTIEEIAVSLRQYLSPAEAVYRSRRIARTETLFSSSYANHESFKSLNISGETQKQWAATLGSDRTRATHFEADGQRVGLEERFQVGATKLRYPGDPLGHVREIVNCRCTCLYIPEGSDVSR